MTVPTGPAQPATPRPPDAGDTGLDYVVGIGSSAGGLEALEHLVGALAAGGRTAYVVAQHLAPGHPSLLPELLARSTRLRVVTAADELLLEPDLVVIAPPGHDVVVEGDRVRLVEPVSRTGPNPSVDRLLESITLHWGDHSVGVVLSGTGSDGAYGMRMIKAANGLTLVQAPQSAKFDSMPRAALALGAGDLVLEPAAIGERLTLLGTPEIDWLGEVLPNPEPDTMTRVVHEVQRVTGIDFSRYKESTLHRQVKRRMAILQVASIDDYLPLLAADAAEAGALVNGLLVTVTSFFRDPLAFEALRTRLATYLETRRASGQLRVWVPGCATGEEVYSIAMLLSDLLGRPADLDQHLKVFGTDLDEAALTVARRAVYPTSSRSSIPTELASRFMLPTAQGLEVVPELRAAVVFARHNVGQDPPFPRLDLISCRNALIYFTPPLQQRVLEMFAYALQRGGLLFLGPSETLGSGTAGFEISDPTHRIFSRTLELVAADKTFVSGPTPRSRDLGSRPTPVIGRGEHLPEAHVAVLEALAALRTEPCLVLNERHEVIEVVGDVQRFCHIAPGRPSTAAASFLRPELAAEARALLLVVRANGERIAGSTTHLAGTDDGVQLVASPLRVGERTMALLEFVSERPPDAPPLQLGERAPEFDAELDRLERELLNSQESLQVSLADLETAHEELLASNEELQASSEELQSSYEELETSNEELQASNEELSVANRQLRRQAEELEVLRRDAELALTDFTRVTDALKEVVWQRDVKFDLLLYVSNGIEALVGLTPGDLMPDAAALDELIVEDDREKVREARSRMSEGWTVDYRLRASDGSIRWVVERGSLAITAAGDTRFVGTLIDVTEQREVELRTDERRRIFEAVFRAPFFGVAILDSDTRVLMANDYFCELLGYEPSSVLRMPLAAFSYPGGADGNGDHPDIPGVATHQLLRRDGSPCWANVDVRALPQLVGEAVSMVIVRDVTQLHDQTEQLARQATTDSATGLVNRYFFQRSLAREIAYCERTGTTLALVWADADQFKEVNDHHGHAAGDLVLRASAERLESLVRATDAVGRLGGDEFGVVLTRYASVAELDLVLERMIVAFRQPISIGNAEAIISVSMGVAVYPNDGVTPDALMQAADAAMYSVKKRGGDGFEYYDATMSRAAEARGQRRAEIEFAIRHHQFELYYQPIVTASDGQLWGVEALIRWNRDGTVVTAEEFIQFCEATGQIRALAPLTFSLLRDDLDLLRASGIECGQICVNMSVSQLEDRGFAHLTDGWPSPIGLRGVVIEVTETVFLPDHSRALDALGKLRRLGARISVDDFGSGYSNLMLLESLAPRYIKLDKSFLATHSYAGWGRALLGSAIEMAHALQTSVVAEGIETEEQLVMVTELGVDLLQGYSVARPMPVTDLIEWVRSRTTNR